MNSQQEYEYKQNTLKAASKALGVLLFLFSALLAALWVTKNVSKSVLSFLGV